MCDKIASPTHKITRNEALSFFWMPDVPTWCRRIPGRAKICSSLSSDFHLISENQSRNVQFSWSCREKKFQLKTLWQWSPPHGILFISNGKAFVCSKLHRQKVLRGKSLTTKSQPQYPVCEHWIKKNGGMRLRVVCRGGRAQQRAALLRAYLTESVY